jgi:hypothetical protein
METAGPVSICGRELLRGWWRPYGEFDDFYSVSPKYFGYTFVNTEYFQNYNSMSLFADVSRKWGSLYIHSYEQVRRHYSELPQNVHPI